MFWLPLIHLRVLKRFIFELLKLTLTRCDRVLAINLRSWHKATFPTLDALDFLRLLRLLAIVAYSFIHADSLQTEPTEWKKRADGNIPTRTLRKLTEHKFSVIRESYTAWLQFLYDSYYTVGINKFLKWCISSDKHSQSLIGFDVLFDMVYKTLFVNIYSF